MMSSTAQRNWDICRLRGVIPGLVSLIPPELAIDSLEKVVLENILQKVLLELDRVKVKRFTCASCANTRSSAVTSNKKAYKCDLCHAFGVPLYLIK